MVQKFYVDFFMGLLQIIKHSSIIYFLICHPFHYLEVCLHCDLGFLVSSCPWPS